MKIITPLRPTSVTELEALVKQLDDRIDVAELWLDQLVLHLMQNPTRIADLQNLMDQCKSQHQLECVATCKTPAENGNFPGNNGQRLQVLQQFLRFNGDWVDLDVSHNAAQIITQIPREQLWLSFHDFTRADLDILKAQFETMQVFKPAVYKFAVTPQNQTELDAFVAWAKGLSEPAIFTTMGALGIEGREQLKPYTWGAFYALNDQHATASGQPTLADL